MCFSKKIRRNKKMPNAKTLIQNGVVPELKTKQIKFSSYPVTHLVRKVGANDIIVTNGKAELLTRARIKALADETVKIRFAGVPRARIGEIVKVVKEDNSSVYVKPVPIKGSRGIAHYDVLIMRGNKDE